MEIDYTKSICGKCTHKKDVQGIGARDLLGRSAPLLYTGAFCKKINNWIPEIKDGDGKIHSDVSECDGFEKKKKFEIIMPTKPPKKMKIPKLGEYNEKTGTYLLIPSPGKGKAIKLCDDGIHYQIINV